MTDQRNLILAIVISVVIVVGFEFVYSYLNPPSLRPPASQTETVVREEISRAPGAEGAAPRPGDSATPTTAAAGASRKDVIAAGPRVYFETSHLKGSISLTGARIDDLTLTTYRETVVPDSPQIVLLSPKDTAVSTADRSTSMFMPRSEVVNTGPYYAWFGWSAAEGVAVPDEKTVWTADVRELAPGRPVTLSWDNGQGLRFFQEIAVDDTFMFTVRRRVENHGTEAVAVSPFGVIARIGTPWISGFYILHEGLLGVFDGTLAEHDYTDLHDEPGGRIKALSTGGWLGITDKYWLVTLIPDQKQQFEGAFTHWQSGDVDKYQVDYLRGPQEIAPGASAELTDYLFAGAKVAATLDVYEQQLGIIRFDLAAAFRWLYFLAMPLFHVLMFFYEVIGNFGIAILLLTVCVKALFFPLANKAYRSMAAMKKLQPEIVKMKERFAGDRAGMQKAMMELYKTEKVNPMMGCLPMLIQIPVFFSLYEVLFVTIEMRHAPFFAWIQDLSSRDPSNLLNPFGIIPFDYPDLLHIGIWPILMGFSMWLQMRLNPQPQDPIQAKIFLFMPIFFTFLLAAFPAGLVIYWTWNNTLSILQQWVIMKRMGVTRPASS